MPTKEQLENRVRELEEENDSEVRSLCLEDIDWENDRFRLKRSKTRRTQTSPLTATVGSTILRYLRKVQRNLTIYCSEKAFPIQNV